MVIFGELLLLLATLIFIVVGFMTSLIVGLIVTGMSFLIWGVMILKVSTTPPKDGGD